jgi:DNA-binding CsgD family transcriptional regulator
MSRLAHVSALISDIYAAALNPEEWPQVMQRALALIGGTAAIVFTRDLNCNTNRFECAAGVEAHLWATMLARQGEPTCLERREQSEPVGTVFQASSAVADAGPVNFIGTLLEKSPTSITGLYIRCRGCTGRADKRSRAMLGLLAPHVRQALCIGRRVEGDASALAQRMQQATGRYGLTPAEVRVVQALLNGCTIERGAQLLGIRPATVKTHLQHVFDKTTARRQVDLIKLIAVPLPAPAADASCRPARLRV